MDFVKLCEDILTLDPMIRFVTVFDMKGTIVQSKHREGLTSILNKKESKKSINEILTSNKTHLELNNKYGKEGYSISVFEKIIRITTPLDKKHILYVTTDVDVDPFSIVKKLTKLLQK
jgi:hypothetical protein